MGNHFLHAYVADEANFSLDEKDNLQALQLTDIGFAEIFLGVIQLLLKVILNMRHLFQQSLKKNMRCQVR